jgi:hypothetical protein
MKNNLKSIATIIAVFAISMTSCTKKTDMEVRFSNQYSKGFKNVTIGSDNFGTVNAGQVTSYMSIPDGSGNISGISTDSTQKLNGTYSLSGTGTHHWTATLSSAGTLSMQEDK